MKTLLKIILISIFLTFISYIFYKIDYSKVSSIWDLVRAGFPDAIKKILNDDLFYKIPSLTLFVFWAIIDTLAYLLYYSLDLIYNNIRNWAVIELFFTKAEEAQKFDAKHYTKRILVHVGIILSYLIFILLVISVAVPLSSFIYARINYFNQFVQNTGQGLVIKSLLVFLVWLAFFSFFTYFFKFIHQKMIEEEIIEEHELGIV